MRLLLWPSLCFQSPQHLCGANLDAVNVILSGIEGLNTFIVPALNSLNVFIVVGEK
jgi:hypothetical protein